MKQKHFLTVRFEANEETDGGAMAIDKLGGFMKEIAKIGDKHGFTAFIQGSPPEFRVTPVKIGVGIGAPVDVEKDCPYVVFENSANALQFVRQIPLYSKVSLSQKREKQ